MSTMKTDADAKPSPNRSNTLYDAGTEGSRLEYRIGKSTLLRRIMSFAPDRSSVLIAKTSAPASVMAS